MPSDHDASVPIPGPKGVRGNLRAMRELLADPASTLDSCSGQYGPTFAIGALPVKMVIVGDPSHLKDVFAQPNESYRWGHFLNPLAFIAGSTSIIVSDGEVHHRRRSAVQPAFARRRLDGWIPMIVAETDQMISARLEPELDAGKAVEFYPVGKDLVMAITVKAFFGNGLEHRTADISAIFDQSQAYLELPPLRQLPHRFPRTQRARVRSALEDFDQLVDDEIARRRALRDRGEAPEEGTGDLLDAFVDVNSSELNAEEIHDQVNTLIGAGFNTTAATLAWTLHRALAAPGVWDRLRAEADAVLGPLDAPRRQDQYGPDTLKNLTYAKAVVHEGLRLHPAGLLSPRQAVIDIPVGDHVVPKSSMIFWSPYLAGRDADVWADPLEFDPDRHLEPSPEEAALMEMAWVPFGRGPRRCIGFALAQMELTLIVARLSQHLRLELVDVRTPRPYGMVVNRPEGGVRVRAAAPDSIAEPV